MISGSSRIRAQQGLSGDTGPVGATGAIGVTGADSTVAGPTGATGATGARVVRGEYAQSGLLVLVLSDGREITIQGLTGATAAYEGVVTGENVGTGFHLFSTHPTSITGGLTFAFVSVTGDGNITVTQSGDLVLIGGTFGYTGANFVDGSTSEYGVAYLGDLNEVASTNSDITLKYQRTQDNALDFLGSVGITGAALFEKNYITNFGPSESGVGITLDISQSSVIMLTTPMGIVGITGQSNNVNELTSFTAFIDGNAFWQLPDNLYFEDNQDYFSCGIDIANFSHIGGTDNKWYVTFASRGHDTEGCCGSGSFGSCCYIEDGQTKCADFVDQRTCQDDFPGKTSFRPFASCREECTTDGDVCCSNGICLEHTSPEECAFYNGTFWSNITCGTHDSDGLNYADNIDDGRFCYDRCQNPYSCCKDGLCLGEYSRIQCEEFLGGISVAGQCGYVDCCSTTNYIGACCREDGICEDAASSGDCILPDIFHGHGSRCAEINCCNESEDIPVGFCCLADGTCTQATQEDCVEEQNGLWGGNGSPCPADCRGSCCLSGGACASKTSQQCQADGGLFGGPGSDCTDTCKGKCCLAGGCQNITLEQCTNSSGTWAGLGSCVPSACGPNGACCLAGGCQNTNQTWCLANGGEFNNGNCNDIGMCDVGMGACCSYNEDTELFLCSNTTRDQCLADNDNNETCWKGGDPADPTRCEEYQEGECTVAQAPFYCGICNNIDRLGPMGCCARPGGTDHGEPGNPVRRAADVNGIPIDNWEEDYLFGYQAFYGGCSGANSDTRVIVPGTTNYQSWGANYDNGWITDSLIQRMTPTNTPSCIQMPLFECCGPPPYFPYCGPWTKPQEEHPDYPKYLGGTNWIGSEGPGLGTPLTPAGRNIVIEGLDPNALGWTGERVAEGEPHAGEFKPQFYKWKVPQRTFISLARSYGLGGNVFLPEWLNGVVLPPNNAGAECYSDPYNGEGSWTPRFFHLTLGSRGPVGGVVDGVIGYGEFAKNNRFGRNPITMNSFYDPTYHNAPGLTTDPTIDYWANPGGLSPQEHEDLGRPPFESLPHDWKILGMPDSFYTGGENGAFMDADISDCGWNGNPDRLMAFAPIIREAFVKRYYIPTEYAYAGLLDSGVDNPDVPPYDGPRGNLRLQAWWPNPVEQINLIPNEGMVPSAAIAAGLNPSIKEYEGAWSTEGYGTPPYKIRVEDWTEEHRIPLTCGDHIRNPGADTCCSPIIPTFPGDPFVSECNTPYSANGTECTRRLGESAFAPMNCFKLWRKGNCKQPYSGYNDPRFCNQVSMSNFSPVAADSGIYPENFWDPFWAMQAGCASTGWQMNAAEFGNPPPATWYENTEEFTFINPMMNQRHGGFFRPGCYSVYGPNSSCSGNASTCNFHAEDPNDPTNTTGCYGCCSVTMEPADYHCVSCERGHYIGQIQVPVGECNGDYCCDTWDPKTLCHDCSSGYDGEDPPRGAST